MTSIKTTIRPGILVPQYWDGEKIVGEQTVYPTGLEWVIAFALRGVPWAIRQLEEYIADEGNRWAGDGI